MALSIILSIVTVTGLFFIYTALGYIILRAFHLFPTARLLRVLSGCTLGFCIVGNLIMVLCFIQQAKIVSIYLLLFACTTIGIPFFSRVFSDVKEIVLSAILVLKSSPWYVSGLFILLFAGYAVRGLLPPTGFDALMYHLSTIKLYLQQGRFWDIYFNAQSDYPMLTEMHFMIGLVFNNDIICKTQSFLLGAMTIAVIAYLCRHFFNDKKIIIPSVLIFFSFTGIIANMPSCNVDIPQALWTVLALVILEKYLEDTRLGYLILSAVIGGMALQTKIFGVFAVSLLLVRLLLERKKSLFSFSVVKEVLTLILIPFGMGLPWYIKSYMYNQTILSISHSSIVGQGLADPMGVACTSGWCYWLVNIVGRIIAAPWTFSIFPGQHQQNTFGPLLVIILPFLFFVKIPRKIKLLLILMGVFMAQILFMEIWFIQGGTSIRYSMIIHILGAPLIVWTVYQINDYPKIQKMFQLMIVGMVCLGTLIFVKRYHKDWIAFLTLQSRDRYYSTILPEYAVIKTINNLPEDKVVMPIYNYSDYLLDVPYITAYEKYASVEEIKQDFREKNIGYIFANDKLDVSKNRETFPGLVEKEILDSTNGFYLFKLADNY